MPVRLVFPTILIVLSISASLFYVPSGDWRHVLYWAAAAVLNFAVTF